MHAVVDVVGEGVARCRNSYSQVCEFVHVFDLFPVQPQMVAVGELSAPSELHELSFGFVDCQSDLCAKSVECLDGLLEVETTS